MKNWRAPLYRRILSGEGCVRSLRHFFPVTDRALQDVLLANAAEIAVRNLLNRAHHSFNDMAVHP